MDGTEIMALYEAKKARRVFLYKNGSNHSEAKCMVLNEKHIRDFGTFLSRVTSGLRAPVAIRNIYTPAEGHVINNLKDLEANHYYVAGGSEQFKRVQYGSRKRDLQPMPRRKITFNDSTFHKAATSSRYRLPPNRPIVIHIYRNGDAHSGKRVLIPSNIARSRDHILELVTTKAQLFTPAKRLHSLDGKPVEVNEIENGGRYVAMEGAKTFQKVSYSVVGDRLSIPPSLSRRTFSKASIQPRPSIRSEKGLQRKSGASVKGDVLGYDHAPHTQPQPLKRSMKSVRPMAGRKNKEGREKAINDLKLGEDSIYGGSPVQYLDESFRTVVHDDTSSTPATAPGESRQDFTDSTHLEATTNSQTLKDSSTSNSMGLVANAKMAAPSKHSTTAVKGTTTPRGSKEVKPRAPKDKNSHPETRYRTEYSRSKQGSRVSREEQQELAGGVEELQGVSRSEKGVFHASNNDQYITAEYADEEQGNAFKAKDKRTEVIGAETVQEGQETEVEQPIDQLKAEMVEEEDGVENEEGVEDEEEGDTGGKDEQDYEPAEEIHQVGEEDEPRKEGSFQLKTEDEEQEVTEEEESKEERAGEDDLLAADRGLGNTEEVEEGAKTLKEFDESKVEEEGQEAEDLYGTEDHFEANESSAAEGRDEEVLEPGGGNASTVQVDEELQEEELADNNNQLDLPAQNEEKAKQRDSRHSSRALILESTHNSDATLQVPAESTPRTPPPRSSPIVTQE